MRRILVTLAATALAVPALAGAASAGTDNSKACFGQDRAAGVQALGGSVWGAIAADRAGTNATHNENYRNSCS